MKRKDYYAILGIARDAQESEIKIAYRKLALKNHPDTNRDDLHAEDRFKEINEAYDVLSNGDKRHQYDLLRDSLTGSSPFRPSTFDRWNHPFETDSFSGFGCRGGGIGRALGRKRKTFRETGIRPAGFAPYQSDLHIHDLSLKSDEAFEGTERDIRLHIGQDTQVFTVFIPAGVENGTLLSFKRPVAENQEIELLFRVTISE